jgi:putative ABC transport system permease protein
LRAELAATPEFESATIASSAPFWAGSYGADLRPSDYTGSGWTAEARSYGIDASYFKTFGIPILAGQLPVARPATDSAAVTEVVVSRGLARQLFGDRDPLGRTIIERVYRGTRQRVITGVVGDVRSSLRGQPDLVMYSTSGPRATSSEMIVTVRTRPTVSDAERIARAVVAKVDPTVPVIRSSPLSESVERSIADERLFGRLISLLAALSALLTAAGLYGIVAYSVAERTREIGLRMALGATAERVLMLVGRQALVLVAAGIALGGLGAAWLSRLLAWNLFGVTPLDPLAYGVGGIVLLAVGALAAGVPARNATRVNPVDALRHD